jgi:hypothetical protein
MDESVETCNKRFAEVGIAPTPENRHAYRDWIIRTPKLNEAIGGAILFDETIRPWTLTDISLNFLGWSQPSQRSFQHKTIVPGFMRILPWIQEATQLALRRRSLRPPYPDA